MIKLNYIHGRFYFILCHRPILAALVNGHRWAKRLAFISLDVSRRFWPRDWYAVDFPNAIPHQIHERRLSPGALRSNGLSPKAVDWRQPEPLGFYPNDTSALSQLDVRIFVSLSHLWLLLIMLIGPRFANATDKKASARMGSKPIAE